MSLNWKSGITGLAAVSMMALGAVAVAGDAAAAWKPKKPVEFIVMAGKGGGADKAVRFMQNIIAKNKLSSKPFTPINKPGGTGAEALVYMKQKQGDNHTIMFTLNSFYTTPLRQPGLAVDIATFAPIGRMAEDTFLLWVHADTSIKSVGDFVKAAKAKGNNWIMAGSAGARHRDYDARSGGFICVLRFGKQPPRTVYVVSEPIQVRIEAGEFRRNNSVGRLQQVSKHLARYQFLVYRKV